MASSSGAVRGEDALSLLGAAGKGASDSRSEAPSHGKRLPRSCRLTSRRQFRRVYARGRRIPGSSFTLFALPNQLDPPRLGLTVTRKAGSAVRRNRIKRRMRELFRTSRRERLAGLDLVINAYAGTIESDYHELERELRRALDRVAPRDPR